MNTLIELALQLTLGSVFLVSGGSKLLHPLSFAQGVAEYDVLPKKLEFVGAFAVIVLELLIAVCHLTGWAIGFAASAGCVLLLIFAGIAIQQLSTGESLQCFCFGPNSSDLLSRKSVARLVLLVVAEGFVLYANRFVHRGSINLFLISDFTDVLVTLGWMTVFFLVSMWALQTSELVCLFPKRLWMNRRFIANLCTVEEI